MNSKLLDLEWNNDTTLFPGSRSTESFDPVMPWLCLSEVIPGIFLTCEQQLSNRTVALDNGIVLIINLCAESHVAPFKVYEYPDGESMPKYRRIETLSEFVDELDTYTSKVASLAMKNRKVFIRNIDAVDAPNYEIDRHFPETCALLELVMASRPKVAAAEIEPCRVPSVGVHCMVGVSRSASVVLAYLMKATGVSRDEALSFVQTTRWVVNPNPGFQQQLLLWEATDSKRIFDDFSARLVANEVKKKRSVVSYVQSQLPTILKVNKCTGERQYFGYVIAEGLSNPDSAEDAAAVYRELRSYITAAIDNEVYADTPNFFGYVAEVTNSVQHYAPALLFQANPEGHEASLVWSDSFYYRTMKDIGRSGFVKDTCDTVRAFCSLLEAIHIKQLEHAPLALVSRPPEESSGTVAPPSLVLSFPFLPFMAPYAEGFVEFSDLDALGKEYPAHGPTLSQSECLRLAQKVASMYISAFLVSSTGASSPVMVARTGNEEEVATAGAGVALMRDSDGRWGDASRLLFLKPDVEVRIFEYLSQNTDLTSVTTGDLLTFCQDCSDEFPAVAAVRKVAGGVLAFRLILEAADRFVADAYSGRLESGAIVNYSETYFPLAQVGSLLAATGRHIVQRFGKPCDLVRYYKMELEPLRQSEVMNSSGVWSLLTN